MTKEAVERIIDGIQDCEACIVLGKNGEDLRIRQYGDIIGLMIISEGCLSEKLKEEARKSISKSMKEKHGKAN